MTPSEPDGGRERRPDTARSSARGGAQEADSVTLGLVPAPEAPERIAHELADELPELLGEHVDDRVSWNVSVIRDPLTGGEEDAPGILDETRQWREEEGWNYAICITDLPIRRQGRVIVADASAENRVGGISLPALGVTLLRRRVREAILQLVSEMHRGTSESDRNREQRRGESDSGENGGEGSEAGAGEEHLRGGGVRQLVGRRLTERLAPLQRITPEDEEMDVDVRFVAPRWNGRARLLAGMVYANRPWRLLYSFKGAVTAAFATGAYALIFPSIWQLGDSFGLLRFVALMLLAMALNVIWTIVGHNLWERPSDLGSRRLAGLYNATTALTLTVGVLLTYVMLYVLILVAAWVFVPGSYIQSEAVLGRPVDFGIYLTGAWITSSLATIAGALGAALEDEDTVLEATYGYRQRRRTEEYRKRRRAEESEDGSQPDGGSVTRG